MEIGSQTLGVGLYPEHGIYFIMFLRRALAVHTPRNKPIFSERNGMRNPLIRVGGWRIFLQNRRGER